MHAATVGRLKNHEEISGSSKLLVLYIYIYIITSITIYQVFICEAYILA